MDKLTLAQKMLGKEKTTEQKSEQTNPSGASIMYMVAVTASSGGQVVLKDEIDESAEWEEGDFIEIDDDGDFEEYDFDDDSMEDIDDTVVDMTDGDGVDIEGTDENSVSFSVADYHEAAVAAYEETEGEVVEDDLPNEDAEISDEIDDGDAEELPDDGEPSVEDDLPDEEVAIDDLSDDEYTLADDNSDDESEEPITGAEISDGYTTADCIGSVKAGDRVMVMIQNGKPIVVGVVGGGDEQEALRQQAQEAAEDAIDAAADAQQKAEEVHDLAEGAAQDAAEAKEHADAANTAAQAANTAAQNAQKEAEEAKEKATDAENKALQVEQNMQEVNNEIADVKGNAVQMRSELETQIETVRTTAEQTFTKKTETAAIETTLRSEFQESIAGIQSTFSQDYAKKSELSDAIVEAKASLQTQITQNANQISLTAKSVEDIQVDITSQNGNIAAAQKAAADAQATATQAAKDAGEAQTAADDAKAQATAANTAAQNAQTEAGEAAQKATDAQNALIEAEKNLTAAQTKLAEVEGNVAASAEDIKAAQDAVQAAQNAVQAAQGAAEQAKKDAKDAQDTADQAKKDASDANELAGNAQAKADEAKEAADKAKEAADKANEDLSALQNRVVTCETKIEETSEAIKLLATKETVTALSTRLQAAEQKITADAIISTVSSTYLKKDDASSTYATKTALSTLTQTVDSITGRVEDAEGNISTLQQTAIGLQLSLTTTNSNVTAAAKTATNFLSYDATNGLLVGNKTSGSWSGSRAQILPTAFNILAANGTTLASYQADKIQLALNSKTSIIDMCNGLAQFSNFADDDWNRLLMQSENAIYLSTSGEIQQTAAYSPDSGITEYLARITVATDTPWGSEIDSEYTLPIIDLIATKFVGDGSADSTSSSIEIAHNGIDIVTTNETNITNRIRVLDYDEDGNDPRIEVTTESFSIMDIDKNEMLRVEPTGLFTDQDIYVGGKGYNDGMSGIFLDADGYMQIQRNHSSYHPYIAFYLNGNNTSTADGQIRVNQSNGYMQFLQADLYEFDKRIEATAAYFGQGIRIGNNGDATVSQAIGTYWKDNGVHYIVERQNDGLTSAFGWAGSASYATVSKIRGRTCQVQNASGTSALSDERLKKDFTELDAWDAFYDALQPCAFRLKTGNSGRYHMGFKAQQVEQALIDAGLTTNDFAGFVRMPYLPDEDDPESMAVYAEAGINAGDDEFGLIYSEFTALNTWKIQKMQKRIDELEKLVEQLLPI